MHHSGKAAQQVTQFLENGKAMWISDVEVNGV